jgi:phage terminase small subunit
MAKRKTKKTTALTFGEGIPTPPDTLPDAAHPLWYRVVMALERMRVLEDIAYPQIVDYCQQWVVYNYNMGVVNKSRTPGVEIFSNGTRGVCKNYSAANEARKQMQTFEKFWGLNPWAANKVTLPEPEGIDSEDDFDL